MFEQALHRRYIRERMLADQHFVYHDPQAVNVSPWGDLIFERLLRGQVIQRTDDQIWIGK